jgi:acyl carrier protein
MSLRARVIKIVEERLSPDGAFALADSDSFLMSGLANSLKLMALLESLESEFQIAVEPGEFNPENLDSVDGILRFLSSKGVSG